MAEYPYASLATQAEQVRVIAQARAEQETLLQAYATMGSTPWGTAILDELVRVYVLGQAMPRLLEPPPGQTREAYQAEVWMREGERQLVQRLLRAVATAPEQLKALGEGI